MVSPRVKHLGTAWKTCLFSCIHTQDKILRSCVDEMKMAFTVFGEKIGEEMLHVPGGQLIVE